MPDKHEPDQRFVEKLEWQLTGELRRLNRRGGPAPISIRILKIAALMLVSIGLGAGAMEASQQIQEGWRKELLEVRHAVHLEIARHRVEMQREALEETRDEVDQGLRDSQDLLQEEQQLAQAQSLVDLMELTLEEIRQSGMKVGTEVDGHDWATEAAKYDVDYYIVHCRDRDADYRCLETLLATGRPVIVAHPNAFDTDLRQVPSECIVEINNRYVWRTNWKRHYGPFKDRFQFVTGSDAHQPNWLGQSVAL